MLMSYAALGDKAHVAKWQARCMDLLPRVKSDTQRAWQLTFMFAALGDEALRRQAHCIVDTWTITPRDRKRSLIVKILSSFSSTQSQPAVGR
jgi:hypothetical protein